MRFLIIGIAMLLGAAADAAYQQTTSKNNQVYSQPPGRIQFMVPMGDVTGTQIYMVWGVTMTGDGQPALIVKATDTSNVASLGYVSTITATNFLGGAFGAAVTKVVPTGVNWIVVRGAPIGASAVSATAFGVVNTASGQVDGGTGAYFGPSSPVVWDNLSVGATGVTLYFGSAPEGGAIPVSLEYGE